MRKTISAVFSVAIMALTLGACGSDDLPGLYTDIVTTKIPADSTGYWTDIRDGSTYKYVSYGNQQWMAQNFRYNINDENNSLIMEDINDTKVSDLETFGRLYTLSGALKACPDGWRLPTDSDWIALETRLGMSESEANKREWRGDIARRMLTVSGDTCDLNLLPTGYYTTNAIMGNSGFNWLSIYAYYWSSTPDTETGENFYFVRKFFVGSSQIQRISMNSSQYMLTVRYVRDIQK